MASLTGDDSDRQPIETYMEPLIEEIETRQSNDINLEVIFSQIRDLIVSPKPRGKKLGSNRKRWKKKCKKCEIFGKIYFDMLELSWPILRRCSTITYAPARTSVRFPPQGHRGKFADYLVDKQTRNLMCIVCVCRIVEFSLCYFAS